MIDEPPKKADLMEKATIYIVASTMFGHVIYSTFGGAEPFLGAIGGGLFGLWLWFYSNFIKTDRIPDWFFKEEKSGDFGKACIFILGILIILLILFG